MHYDCVSTKQIPQNVNIAEEVAMWNITNLADLFIFVDLMMISYSKSTQRNQMKKKKKKTKQQIKSKTW